MIIGLYQAKNAMKLNIENQNIISNNIANANTTGYKKDRLIIKDFNQILKEKKSKNYLNIDNKMATNSYTDFSAGTFKQTNNKLDLAINGKGFFAIHRNNDIVFSRKGNFHLDKDRNIVDSEGNYLVGKKGPINLTGKKFNITSRGEVYVDNRYIDQIVIGQINNPSKHLRKIGNGYFAIDNIKNMHNPKDIEVKQGYLETSNVNTIDEMVKMIENQRLYSMNEKSITAIDSTIATLLSKVSG